MNRHKYLRQPSGTKHYNARLSETEVLELKELSQFIACIDLSKAYSVSESTVYFIKTGQRWTNLTNVRYTKIRSHRSKKLTLRKAENIRKQYKLGLSQNKLAKKYKVSQPVIFDIVHKRTHV